MIKFFNLHTHKFSAEPSIRELVNQYPRELDPSIPFCSIGIHPWHIREDMIAIDLEIIERKLMEGNCAAVGECGLDKIIKTPLELQMEVFEKQLILAQKYGKPVIIHCVGAYQELIGLKNRLQITVPLIVHGFAKGEELARQLIDKGFYLSLGKYLFRNPELKDTFLSIPDDRFFLETDTGKEDISEVYELAAIYKNCTVEEMKEQIERTFNTVFASQPALR